MPLVQCACPSCRTVLQLNQALPVQVRCPRCGLTFLVGAPPTAAQVPVSVSAPAAPQPAPAGGVQPLPQIPMGVIAAGRSGLRNATALRRQRAPQPRPGGGQAMFLWIGAGAGAVLLLLVLVLILTRGGSGGAADIPDAIVNPDGAPLTEQQKKINEAVRKGVAYLRRRLLDGSKLYAAGDPRGGAHPGAVALAGLTLLECGVRPEDPALQTALTTVRGQAPDLAFTYSIAAAILFLDRLNNPAERPVDPNDRQLIQSMALRLIAGQKNNGGWAYHCQPLPANHEQSLRDQLQGGRFVPGSFLVPGQMPERDDNSIGQFATLALWSARKHGVRVRASLQAVERRYRPRQQLDGTWIYTDNLPVLKETSTCAGLIGLAVASGVEDEEQPEGAKGQPFAAAGKPAVKDVRKDPAVEKALRFLGGVVGRQPNVPAAEQEKRRQHTARMERVLRELETANDFDKLRLIGELRMLDSAPALRGIYLNGDNWGDLYFLWSLERMAVIYDLKMIEGKDWYAWGSEILLANQESDGSWSERFPGVPDTCFALLFLKRANVVKDLTDKLRRLREGLEIGGAPGNRPGGPGNPPVPKRKE